MSLSTGSVWSDSLLAVVVLVYLIYRFLTNNYDYWDKKGVPNIKGGFILVSLLGRRSQSDVMIEMYKSFPNEKYFGIFEMKQPTLVVKDLDLINKILVKDFTYFQDRGGPVNKKDPMNEHLFNLTRSRWRAMRYKLIPTFTTGKLKGMFEQLVKCGDNMVNKIEQLTSKHSDIEAKSFLFGYTSEVIASCAFGLQFDSQDLTMFKNVVTKVFKPSYKSIIKFIIFRLFPGLIELLDLRTFIQKEEADYFLALLKATTKYRRENNVKRNDYLQLLLTLQDHEDSGVDMSMSVPDTSEDDAVIDQMKYAGQRDQTLTHNTKLFTDKRIAANSAIFLIAGSEPTSSTITHTLLELARHPEVQRKLQQEVDRVLAAHSHCWTYQTLKDMDYLDEVVQETQRLYPVVPILMRQCTKQYLVPYSDLVIEEGTLVAIPVIALHKDPYHYPDPEAFHPERFQGNNFKPNAAYLPYGDGPRICIAMRFAVMEVKTAIARIMTHYTVELGSRNKLPFKMNPRTMAPVIEGGVWLTFLPREKPARG